jgi:hypothetical protein
MDVPSVLFWGPVVVAAVVAALAGFVVDRRRARPGELLANGSREDRSRAQLRYFAEVGDSSNG